jgi:hypothetical protein
MTDLEISKALALAIGWKDVEVLGGYVLVYTNNPHDRVYYRKRGNWVYNHRIFDYRDWAIAGPIAEKYDCFPEKHWQGPPYDGWLAGKLGSPASSPQKAIALAVIGAKK